MGWNHQLDVNCLHPVDLSASANVNPELTMPPPWLQGPEGPEDLKRLLWHPQPPKQLDF